MIKKTLLAGKLKFPVARTFAIAIVIAVIVVLIILSSLLFALILNSHPASTPEVVNRSLLHGTVIVDAESFWYLQFTIPSRANDIQISGSFTVLGQGSDIQIYFMNETIFNGNAIPNSGAYYDSKRVSTANYTFTLPSGGTYYLIYDNTFSSQPKNVDTQAILSYAIVPS